MYTFIRIMLLCIAINALGLVAMLNVPDNWMFLTGLLTAFVDALALLNFTHHKGLQD